MRKLKAGDKVKVLKGRDSGREAIVERVVWAKGRVFLPGVNIYKKHVKAQFAKDGKGGIYEIPRPIPISNISLICPNCNKVTRVGFRVGKEGGKTRICKKCKMSIDSKVKEKTKKS